MCTKFMILCIDPGPLKSGYAFIRIYDDDYTWIVTDHGTMGNEKIIEEIKERNELTGVAVEEALMYTFPGKGKVNNKQISKTIFQVGRMYQAAMNREIEFRQQPRINIITTITGSRPKRGKTISKTEMQKVIQKLMGLDKIIRPQHANDAVCAGVALYEHPDLPKYIGAKINEPKETGRKPKKSTRRGSGKTK